MSRTFKHPPRLTPAQALVVLELSRTPGAWVPTYLLTSAAGYDDEGVPFDVAKFRVHALISDIRRKFGSDCIEARIGSKDDGGYRIPPRKAS